MTTVLCMVSCYLGRCALSCGICLRLSEYDEEILDTHPLLAGDLETADKALIDREIEIKTRSRAKLCKRDDYTNDAWIGGRYLDYRFSSAKRIITDIYRGEETAHV